MKNRSLRCDAVPLKETFLLSVLYAIFHGKKTSTEKRVYRVYRPSFFLLLLSAFTRL